MLRLEVCTSTGPLFPKGVRTQQLPNGRATSGIHRAAEKECIRKLGFRRTGFSETRGMRRAGAVKLRPLTLIRNSLRSYHFLVFNVGTPSGRAYQGVSLVGLATKGLAREELCEYSY